MFHILEQTYYFREVYSRSTLSLLISIWRSLYSLTRQNLLSSIIKQCEGVFDVGDGTEICGLIVLVVFLFDLVCIHVVCMFRLVMDFLEGGEDHRRSFWQPLVSHHVGLRRISHKTSYMNQRYLMCVSSLSIIIHAYNSYCYCCIVFTRP